MGEMRVGRGGKDRSLRVRVKVKVKGLVDVNINGCNFKGRRLLGTSCQREVSLSRGCSREGPLSRYATALTWTVLLHLNMRQTLPRVHSTD